MSKIKCPHCGKSIVGKSYRVTFQTKAGEETSIIWDDCYTPEHAVFCAKEFDDNFLRLVKVEEVGE